MNLDEVMALIAYLQNFGVLVRLVDKDFRHAALIGTLSSLVSVPTTKVDGHNFAQIKDYVTGVGLTTGGAIAFAGALVTIFTVPVSVPVVIGCCYYRFRKRVFDRYWHYGITIR